MPDEQVRKIQRMLNEQGYTDKFGEPLKEDGLVGGKTLYALFSRVGELPKPIPEIDRNTFFGDNVVIKPKGYLSKGDEQYSESKQTLIKCSSFSWFNNDGNADVQKKIHGQAERLRKFDDQNIVKAYLLNNSIGAGTSGHNAIMVVDKNGMGMIFSVFSSGGNPFNTDAELRFSALSKEKVDAFVNSNGKMHWIYDMVATDGAIQHETYDRLAEFEITKEQGSDMFEFAVNRYNSPGDYNLLSNNCNDFAVNCLWYGGIDIFRFYYPNNTYIDAKGLEVINKFNKLFE